MKKKIFGITLAVCLIVLSIASTTMAYFTDTDDEINVFTAGNVDIDLNNDVLGTYQDGKSVNVYPGMEIGSGATVKNDGTEDAYVGIIITLDKQFTEAAVKTLFKLADDSYTYKYDDATKTTTVYIVNGAELESGDEVTFFEKISVPTTWGNSETAVFKNAKITVKAYATQTYGFTDAKTALARAFNSAWGALVPNP